MITQRKERQGYVHARLAQVNGRLREISMIDMSKIPHDRVGLGSTVMVLDITKDERIRYKLVTSEDVDVAEGLNLHQFSDRSAACWASAVGDSDQEIQYSGRPARDGNHRAATTIHRADRQ